jgi:nicotinamidase-related amidase
MTLTRIDDKAALIVIDLQQALTTRTVHPVGEVVGRASRLAASFRARGLPVVLVNATGSAPGRTNASQAGYSRSAGWADILPALGPRPSDTRITKQTWGAFHNTPLDRHLRGLGVTQVVLAGVATSIGVESTARAAHEHAYHVVLVTDAMTDGSADAHHNSTTRIFPRLGETATTEQVLEKLGETASQARDRASGNER